MDYQRTDLATGAPVGPPGPLPAALVGLSDAALADMSASLPEAAFELGYAGQGFIPLVRSIPALTFKQRLPANTRIAIRAAAATDAVIADFLDLLDTPGAGLIDLDNADTVAGVAYLLAHSLITADQATALRA